MSAARLGVWQELIRIESQKCIEYMHFRTITFATLETLIFLRLPGCRKTPNFRDNLFLLLVTGICSAKYPLIARLYVYPILRRADADFDNLQRADIGFERC